MGKTMALYRKVKGSRNTDIVALSVVEPHGYIASFGVHPQYRKRGLGHFMLRCTVQCMVDLIMPWSSLHVAKGNRTALNLYKAAGFKICGELEDAYTDDAHGHDAWFMEKTLSMNKNKKYINLKHMDEMSWGCIFRI